MPNHIKFCGCPMCRTGKHHSARAKARVRRVIRSHRRRVKMALIAGRELPGVIAVGYTD